MDDDLPSPTVRTPIPEVPAPPNPPPTPAPEAMTAPSVAPLPVEPATPTSPIPPVEPNWAPTTASRPRDRGRLVSVIFGFIILAVGLWFFADHTLGLELPTISWSQLWPLLLIAVGGWIVLGTLRRNDR